LTSVRHRYHSDSHCRQTEAKSIIGLEIQEEMAEMAQRSVKLNNLEDRVK